MAFVVQNDQGSAAGANAYIDVDFFRSYFADRGSDVSSYLDADVQTAIVRATDYLDGRFNFVGKRMLLQQTTQWPRMSAYDRDRYLINTVPIQVKEATAEYAMRALTAVLAPDPTYDGTGAAVQSKMEKVDVIEEQTTYVSGAVFQMPRYPSADQKLIKAGLTRSGGDLLRA